MTPSSDTDFTLDETLDAAIRDAAVRLACARHPMALTGAGLSVESGIPPFRGPGGIWTKYGEPPMDGYQRFLRDPAAYWRERLSPKQDWMRALGDAVREAKPNPGHAAFVELERRGMLAALERLVKANVSTGQTLRKKRNGLTPDTDTITPWITNISARPM